MLTTSGGPIKKGGSVQSLLSHTIMYITAIDKLPPRKHLFKNGRANLLGRAKTYNYFSFQVTKLTFVAYRPNEVN